MAWIPVPSRAITIIQRLERKENFLDNSIELFQACFKESHSPDQYPKRMEEIGSVLAEGTGYYVDLEIAQAMGSAILDPDAGVRLVVDRLHGLAPLFYVPYKPDGPEDASSLEAAIHYHATLLVRAMRQSSIGEQRYGYGDDIVPAYHELERLWLRYGRSQFRDTAYNTVHL